MHMIYLQKQETSDELIYTALLYRCTQHGLIGGLRLPYIYLLIALICKMYLPTNRTMCARTCYMHIIGYA